MKINTSFSGFSVSAKGMSIQKKKMNLITENIANTATTKTSDGSPYRRKFISVEQKNSFGGNLNMEGQSMKLHISNSKHISNPPDMSAIPEQRDLGIAVDVNEDNSVGEIVFQPEHPDANDDGFVQMPNVNIVTEMVDMIASTRSYEANLTAFNASKQIAKDSLEI